VRRIEIVAMMAAAIALCNGVFNLPRATKSKLGVVFSTQLTSTDMAKATCASKDAVQLFSVEIHFF
jgi:hypothetical protein